MIHPTAIIHGNVIIGKNVRIGAYSVIGDRGFHKGYEDGKEIMPVKIDNNVIIGSHVTINAGVEKPTVISEGCKIMNHVNIGHDTQISENCIIGAHSCLAGFVRVYAHCNIGVSVTVKNRITINEGCMIGMGSIVIKNTSFWAKYAGNPAKEIGFNSVGAERNNVQDAEIKYAEW